MLLEPSDPVCVEALAVELDLRVTRGRWIAGWIGGDARAVAELTSVTAKGAEDDFGRFVVPEDGRFRIGPLAPGEYEVWASGETLRTETVRVSAGREDLELVPLPPSVAEELPAVPGEPAARLTIVHRAEDRARRLELRVGGARYPVERAGASELEPCEARAFVVPPGTVAAELLEDGRVVAREERVLRPSQRARIELVPSGVR